jgi:glycosyltransferase involved in cell wall biosynthesis
MKLTIALEARFFKTPDQKVWSDTGIDEAFWQRYLKVFDSIEVIARVKDVSCLSPGYTRADGDKIDFIPLPHYIGPYQYLWHSLKICALAETGVKNAEAVLLRTPGQIASVVFRYLRKYQHPFGVEVVGDPYDVFAPGSVDHAFRFFFRWIGTKQLKEQCKYADGASYVTEKTLQARYPNALYSTCYSSIDLSPKAYVLSPKIAFGEKGLFKLSFIGSLAQLYKSPDILIDAVNLCRNHGHNINLEIIGDGKFRPQLEARVLRLGLNNAVNFLGQLPSGELVRNVLLQSDIFVLPSRTEGLPRAMIEAMACGLPCIGANVGGVPELLSAFDLVSPGDAQSLAKKIEEVITNPARMRDMSARNLEKSMEFRGEILDRRRCEFYAYLHNKTETWIKQTRTRH